MEANVITRAPTPRGRTRPRRATASELDQVLAGSGVALVADRRLPGTTVEVDRIAAGPQGVTVIDTHSVRGKVRVTDGRLLVAGRDRTSIVAELRRAVDVIRLGLGNRPDVPVAGAICWVEVNGLPLLRTLRVDGVAIARPRPLAEQLRRPGPVSPTRARSIAELLDARLPAVR